MPWWSGLTKNSNWLILDSNNENVETLNNEETVTKLLQLVYAVKVFEWNITQLSTDPDAKIGNTSYN